MASKSDITPKAREQYAWAIPHIEQGLGAIPLARLDRDDVADWINALASAGTLSRRSVQICRNVLRAIAADAVEEGLIPRSPAARVALPRTVAKPVKEKVIQAWEATDVQRFLAAVAEHRWAVGFQLGVLYGLRRSEVLALRWDDFDSKGRTLRIDESLVAVNRGAVLGDAKNVRSRRLVPLSDDGVRALKRRRTEQAEERLLAGSEWEETTSSSPPVKADSYSPVHTIERWRSLSTRPSCHASPRMVCATPRQLTWSTTRRTSASFGDCRHPRPQPGDAHDGLRPRTPPKPPGDRRSHSAHFGVAPVLSGFGIAGRDCWVSTLEDVCRFEDESAGAERDGEVVEEPDLAEHHRRSLVWPRRQHCHQAAPPNRGFRRKFCWRPGFQRQFVQRNLARITGKSEEHRTAGVHGITTALDHLPGNAATGPPVDDRRERRTIRRRSDSDDRTKNGPGQLPATFAEVGVRVDPGLSQVRRREVREGRALA